MNITVYNVTFLCKYISFSVLHYLSFKESVKLCACDLQKTFSLIFAAICSLAPVDQQGFLH